MGLSLDNLAVVTLVHQLNSIEAEALSIMGALSNLSAQKTQLSNALLDSKSNMTAMEPRESDYYYTVSTGYDESTGTTYSIDSRYQDYSAITTDTQAGVMLTATKKVSGTTLKAGDSLPVLKGGAFVGTVIDTKSRSYDAPKENEQPSGVIGKVNVIDPGSYVVQRGTEEDKDGNEVPHYEPATSSDKIADFYIANADGTYKEANLGSNACFLSDLDGCSAVKGNSKDGWNANSAPIGLGEQFVYIPNGAASNVTPSDVSSIHMSESGNDQLNEAFNSDQSLNNLYYIVSSGQSGTQCKKVQSVKELQELQKQGVTFIAKTGDVTTETKLTNKYYDMDNKDAATTIGGYSPMDINEALESGSIPQDKLEELITAAVHAWGSTMGYDDNGNLKCDANYVRNNYDIVQTGDNQWGLVIKDRSVSDMTKVYQLDTAGEYDEPAGQIPAHNLQFDANGNLIGFQGSNNAVVKLETTRVKDQKGYDDAMKEYNSNLKAAEIEQNNINKDLNDLAQEDADMEARLTYLDSQKKTVEGFLEAAKSLAKSDAERLGKAFSG